jgi:diacylglycerol kinase (ATP)
VVSSPGLRLAQTGSLKIHRRRHRALFACRRLKTRFIVNPRSGAATRALPLVRAYAERRGAELVLTTHRRHAFDLAAAAVAAGCERVVAVGGDGTMNEIASAVVGSSAVLGLVPCGSGDGLGRHLGLHGPVARALEILDSGQPRAIDAGLADGHSFFTVAGFGFEADVSARFNELTKRGFARYLSTAVRTWREFQPLNCSIEHSGQTHSLSVFTLAVANSDQYGNNAWIAPGARVDDGQLDLTAISKATALNGIPLLTRLFTGTLAASANVKRLRSSRFVIQRPGPGLLHTDGETHHAGARVEFTVRPGSLRVLAPAKQTVPPR